MTRLFLVLALLSASVASAVSQQTQARANSAQIEGTVIDAITGQPISDATVEVYFSNHDPAETNEEGKFVLKEMPAGTHRITVTKEGYAPARPEGRKTPGNEGISLTVPSGQTLKGVVIRLTPGGIVTGTILDTKGRPAEDVQVTLLLRSPDYRQRFSLAGPQSPYFNAKSNDRGEFRIFSVTAGEYYLHLGAQGGFLHQPAGEMLVEVYYPGVEDISKARTILVKNGEEQRLGVVSMPLAKTVPVHIRVVNETGETPGVRGIRIGRDSSFTSARAFGGANAIEIPGLPPGQHVVAVDWPTSSGAAFGETTLQVGNDEITADLVVRKGVPIRGHVMLEATGGARPLSDVRVSLEPRSTLDFRIQGLSQRTKGDGAFFIGSVPLLEYHLAFDDLPPDTYVRSATAAGRDVLAQNVRIAGETDIDIVVAPSAGAIEGTVKNANGQKVSGALVVLVPEQAVRGNEDLYRLASSDQDGKFVLRGAVPGRYKVFAWMELTGPDFFDTSFMQKFEPRGGAVEAVQGKPAKIDITLADEESAK